MNVGFSDYRIESAFYFNAPVAIATVDPNGRFLDANDAFVSIVGFSRSELIIRDFQSITHPDDLAGDVEMMQDCIRGRRQYYTTEKRYLPKHGNKGYPVWVKIWVRGIYDPTGKLEFFVVHVVPLPNGGNFKVERKPDGELVIRPSQKLTQILKDDWKTAAVVFAGLIILFADKIKSGFSTILELLKLFK